MPVLPLGPTGEGRKMCAATPVDSTWSNLAPGPTVDRPHPGKLQRYPARAAIMLLVRAENSDLEIRFMQAVLTDPISLESEPRRRPGDFRPVP